MYLEVGCYYTNISYHQIKVLSYTKYPHYLQIFILFKGNYLREVLSKNRTYPKNVPKLTPTIRLYHTLNFPCRKLRIGNVFRHISKSSKRLYECVNVLTRLSNVSDQSGDCGQYRSENCLNMCAFPV